MAHMPLKVKIMEYKARKCKTLRSRMFLHQKVSCYLATLSVKVAKVSNQKSDLVHFYTLEKSLNYPK